MELERHESAQIFNVNDLINQIQRISTRFAALTAVAFMAACTAMPSQNPELAAAIGPQPEEDGPKLDNYRAAEVGQATLLLGRTSIIEPLIRPFSTEVALISLLLKSSYGFAQRVAIDMMMLQNLESEPIPPVGSSPGMNLDEWEEELEHIAGTATRGTVEFLVDGPEFFPRFLDVIEHAEESVDIRTYIFDNDDFGVEVANLLKERSKEIVVRVLIDGIGAIIGTRVDAGEISEDFEPPLDMRSHLRMDSDVRVRTSGNPFLTGDHSKTTIVDGERAFLGGMNIGREYRFEWHDLMMEVTGPVVDILRRDSDLAWARASWLGDLALFARFLSPRPNQAGSEGVPLTVLETKDHDSQIYRAQLAAIRRAQSHIYIENPYFSDDAILYELAKARRRGVDVRVILPDEGNHAAHNYSNQISINTMLRNGIRVYLYPGMSHVKAAVYDGWACFGSANFDKLSLQINEEINIGTSDPQIVGNLLERVFLPDFEVSRELTEPVETGVTHRIAEIISDEFL